MITAGLSLQYMDRNGPGLQTGNLPSHNVCQTDFRITDLSLACLIPQLPYEFSHLSDSCSTDGVSFG